MTVQSLTLSSDKMILISWLFLVSGVRAGSLAEELVKAGASRLMELVVEAGLEKMLSSGGPWTILAPEDKAFQRIPQHILTGLSSDPELLRKVVMYHVISGAAPISSMENNVILETLAGSPILVNIYLQSQYYEARQGPGSVGSTNITWSGLHHTQW